MPAQSRTTPSPSTGAPAPETTTPAATTSDPQNTVGNAAVASGIGNGAATASAAAPPPNPSWSKAEISAVQTELKRLGLYTLTIDGLFGKGSRGGLDKAFGNSSWASMSAGDVLARLKGQGQSTPGGQPGAAAPAWSKAELIAIQTELARMTLYRTTIDGLYGRGTSAALVEAFGSEEWMKMSASDVTKRLKAAATPEGNAAEKKYRYGEMFKDGLLDVTIGVGFDESGTHLGVIDAFQDVLDARGFKLDAGAAQGLYKAAGRAVENATFGKYFVKSNALTYKPPAGPARKVNAVVRFVDNGSGDHGKEAKDAFAEGMTESDAVYYGGHGRYGSGPDFDRNVSFDFLDAAGNLEQTVDDYEQAASMLKEEGKAAGRDAWGQFEFRLKKRTMRVNGSNEGNIFLNEANKHPGEFGSKLMYWNLLRTGGAGAEKATGADGDLAKRAKDNPQHKYTLAVFNGCRTQDYVKSLRGTPGMDAKGADVVASTRTLYWSDMANTLGAWLDGVIAQQSAQDVVGAMDDQQVTLRPTGDAGKGFDNF